MLEILAHDTGLWITFSFIIFVIIAYRLGKNSILNGLDSKITEIKNEIETAERLRVEAQELLAQYQRKQRDAEAEAQDILARARHQAEQLRKTAEQELADIMNRREDQLAERLRRIEENAIADIRNHAADLAVTASQDIIIKTLDETVNNRLNQATINTISKSLN